MLKCGLEKNEYNLIIIDDRHIGMDNGAVNPPGIDQVLTIDNLHTER